MYRDQGGDGSVIVRVWKERANGVRFDRWGWGFKVSRRAELEIFEEMRLEFSVCSVCGSEDELVAVEFEDKWSGGRSRR